MTEPVRVLMLFTILNRGGAETMVMNYYRHIDRSKVQFDFLVHRQERGAYEDEIESLGGHVYRLMPLLPLHVGAYKRQISAFFDAHPDYRIVHGHCCELGLFIYREAARRNIPVIIAHAHNAKEKFDLKWLARIVLKHALRPYITHCFACGKEAARWLFGKQLASHVVLQRNAIETDGWKFDSVLRETKRKELEVGRDTHVIGHVGRFYRQKNHSFLIEVFDAYHKQHADSVLVLIGTGEREAEIHKKVSDKGLSHCVRFLGSCSNVAEWVNAMDVFLFPSLWEGFPVSVVEAQANGLPCLLSGNISHEVALTPLVRFLSLKSDLALWVDALCRMVKQEQMHPNRASYALEVARAGYDIKENALWLQNFYLSAIGSKDRI